MFFHPRFFSIILCACLVSACATDRTFGLSPDIEITELTELPPPRFEGAYAIGPQEKLEIQVVGVEDLSGPYLTNAGGNIFFPFLGEVETGGEVPEVAARMIADGLRGRYLLDPQVRIIPEELPVPAISIGGQEEKPGAYPAVGDPTLLRAVNMAEGLSDYAQLDDVLIMRTVDGQNYIGVYNIGAIQRGNYPDPQLYANDIVMVGDSPARRRLENILQFVPVFSSAAVIIDRLGR